MVYSHTSREIRAATHAHGYLITASSRSQVFNNKYDIGETNKNFYFLSIFQLFEAKKSCQNCMFFTYQYYLFTTLRIFINSHFGLGYSNPAKISVFSAVMLIFVILLFIFIPIYVFCI